MNFHLSECPAWRLEGDNPSYVYIDPSLKDFVCRGNCRVICEGPWPSWKSRQSRDDVS